MLDALAMVLPFILVSAPLKKVIAYSQTHNRPTQGWFVALVGGTLTLLSMVFIHFFPEWDASITLIDFGLILFGAGVILRALCQSAEWGKLKAKFFYPLTYALMVGVLVMLVPEGFYGHEATHLLWAERLGTAALWLAFTYAFSKQDTLDGNVAMQTVLICVGLSMMAKGVALFSLIIAGSAMGFMRFNRPPGVAKMGFTGSFWLGFILFGLAIISLIPHPLSNPGCLTLMTLFLLPILDGLQAFVKKALKRSTFSTNLWPSCLLQSGDGAASVLLRNIGVHFLLFLAAILGYVAQHSLYTLLFGALFLGLYNAYIGWLTKPTSAKKPRRNA